MRLISVQILPKTHHAASFFACLVLGFARFTNRLNGIAIKNLDMCAKMGIQPFKALGNALAKNMMASGQTPLSSEDIKNLSQHLDKFPKSRTLAGERLRVVVAKDLSGTGLLSVENNRGSQRKQFIFALRYHFSKSNLHFQAKDVKNN